MLPPAVVVCAPREPRFLAERTRRWLQAAGFRTTVKQLDDLAWARSLRHAAQPAWWVAAGALPGPAPEAIAELAAAIGGEAVALVGTGPQASDELGASGGARLLDWSSLLLEPKLQRRFAARREAGAPFVAALAAALTGARALRQAPLELRCDRRLRVLELCTSLQRGGAERLVLELAAALRELDVGVELATTGRATRGAFATDRVVHAIPGDAAAIAARAIALGCDVIHAHLLPQATVTGLAAHAVPLVVTVHNARAGWPRGLAEVEPDRRTLYVACSQHAAGDLRGAALPIVSRMVWNGIPTSRVAPSPSRDAAARALRAELGLGDADGLILTVANPRRQKRFDRIPGVLARLLASAPPTSRTVWAILGETGGLLPDARAAEAELAAALAAQPPAVAAALVRLPPVDDVAPALRAADVIVSVSDWEGLSLAHLEALAADRPLVATAAGGTIELAAAAPDLTLLPLPADDATIAAAIAAAQPSTGAGARLVNARFAVSRMAERYRALFDHAASRDRDARGIDLCLVINNFSTGGAQTSARRLLGALRARGLAVAAITVEEQPEFPTTGAQALAASGVPVRAAPAADLQPIEEAIRPVLRWLGELRPKATLLWNLRPSYKIRIADAATDTRLFDVSPGEMNFSSLDRFFARPLDALPYATARDYGARLAGAIVKYLDEAGEAERQLGTRVHVIANGVPLQPRVARPSGAVLTVGTSARLSPQKRLEELIDAVAIATARAPLRLVIAGDPERGAEGYLDALRVRAVERRVALDVVHGLDDVSAFLQTLDLFALIAEPPGCPNASLEALAHGLPVVATDVGGMREQILDGVTGLLTPRGDVPAMAAAIGELARDPQRRALLAAAGHAHAARHFSIDRMADDYLRVCLGE